MLRRHLQPAHRIVICAFAALATSATLSAHASPAHPLSYMSAFGNKATTTLPLTWGLLAISIAVIVIVAILLVTALRRRRLASDESIDVRPAERATGWVYAGVGISAFVLTVALVWTV